MVIIPSIGRNSLVDLVEQIKVDERDSGIDAEIFVALNGILPSGLEFENVHILNISKDPIGVAAAMNSALNKVHDGLVWTIADDETWKVGKFRSDLESIRDLEGNWILLPSSIFNDELGKAIRPRIRLKEGERLLDYLYGHIHFLRNPRYISLSGACAKRSTWLNVKFSETMQTREDIDYVYRQEMLGCKFVQSTKVTVGINVKLERGAIREQGAAEAYSWATERLTRKQRVGFIGCAWVKPLVYSGNLAEMKKMKKLLASQRSFIFSKSQITTFLLLSYWIIVARIIGFKLGHFWRTNS